MLNINLFNFVLKNSKTIIREKMPLLIRTDLMDPAVYLSIELKYKSLIMLLYHCGGYAFHGQISRIFSSQPTASREITKMEEMYILGSTTLNKNSYVYLQDNGLKYALHNENYEILTREQKIKIPFLLVSNSADLPLKSSAAIVEYNLQYLKQQYGNCKLDNNQNYEIFLSKSMALHWINQFYEIRKDFSLDAVIPQMKTMFERGRIYMAYITAGGKYIDETDIKSFDDKDILFRFVIFDHGELTEKILINNLIKISKFMSLFGYETSFENSIPESIEIDMSKYQGVKVNKYQFELEICTSNPKRIDIINDAVSLASTDIRNKNKFILKVQFDDKYIKYSSKEELIEKRDKLKEQYISGFTKAIVNDKIAEVGKYFKHPLQKTKGILKSQDINRIEELRKLIQNHE